MKWRKILAAVAATAVLCTCSVSARSAVLYDGGEGEPLNILLKENADVWPASASPADGKGPAVHAKGAVLMDQGSGAVLVDQDGRKRLPIASVTKVMTLLLVMEALDEGRIHWEDTVSCSEEAASMGGSQIWLEPGEIMTVHDLVKAAAVVSANDACTALAEHVSGSSAAFVENMNRRARELGMENTAFKDCSGLDDNGYSCAYDVAVMSRELMKHSAIQEFTTIWMDTLRSGKSQLVNTNKLVRHYKGATGLKTGTTQAAGHCLTATAKRGDTAFVAVVLGCDTTAHRFGGARALLDYGFSSYESYTPDVTSLPLQPVPVLKGQEIQVVPVPDRPTPLLLKKGTADKIESRLELAEDVQAPVEKGQILGTWKLMSGDQELASYPVRAAQPVPAVTLRWAYRLLMDALLA